MESLSFRFRRLFSDEEDSRLNNLRETYTSFGSTPLHIAVMSGDIKFATKILSKPGGLDLALKQDSNGFTPLHLASVRTSLPIVRLLLEAEPGACVVQDEDARTPLHLAAMQNRVEIMKVLMEEGLPEAIHLRNGEETILHLCVKSNTKLKTLKILAGYLAVPAQPPYQNSISIDSTDNDDNTILHLAVELGNMKITNYLVLNNDVRVDMNIKNKKGLKALDMATLIAGIAFQAAMNPPGGVWQDDSKVNSSTDPVTFSYYLVHMFGPSFSGGLERYVQDHLHNPAETVPGYWVFRDYNKTITKREENEAYPIIQKLVYNLWRSYQRDVYYRQMVSKGLILEDFMFTDTVSNYTDKATNGSQGGFYPYLIRYAGTPILAYTWPRHYMVFMVTNAAAFFASLAIILLVICGFLFETSITQVRILVVLMSISVGCIATSYLSTLIAMMPHFYMGLYIYIIIQLFFGVCIMLEVIYVIWTLAWKIVKLRKRTRNHHIGVITYVKVLFFSMDAKDAGKLILFILGYAGFRISGYVNYDTWSYKNRFLY